MQGRSPPQDYGLVLEAPLKSGEGREHFKTKKDNEIAGQHLTPQQEAALEVESVQLACNLRRMDAPHCIAFLGAGSQQISRKDRHRSYGGSYQTGPSKEIF